MTLIVFSEALFSRTHDNLVTTFRAGLTLVVATWGLLWMVRLRTEALLFQPAPKTVAPASGISPRDAVLMALFEGL